MKHQHHVLVVDDSVDHRKILQQTLVEEDISVDMAKNSQEALDFLSASKYDVVLLDLVLPDMSGLDLLETIQNNYPMVPVIVMSAFGNEKDAVSSIKKGASDFITKSVGFELRIADTVKNTIKNISLKKQIDEAQERYEQIYHAANDFMFTL
ncbi:MAG: response regulator, partial [Calditrichaeota bacterium]|nr:response regulator [Calditrichota bacterium]